MNKSETESVKVSLEDVQGFASVTLLRGQIVRMFMSNLYAHWTVFPVGRDDL